MRVVGKYKLIFRKPYCEIERIEKEILYIKLSFNYQNYRALLNNNPSRSMTS